MAFVMSSLQIKLQMDKVWVWDHTKYQYDSWPRMAKSVQTAMNATHCPIYRIQLVKVIHFVGDYTSVLSHQDEKLCTIQIQIWLLSAQTRHRTELLMCLNLGSWFQSDKSVIFQSIREQAHFHLWHKNMQGCNESGSQQSWKIL